ncbi:hypothetical protein Tco_0421687 [Tanacetum coccineum]
MGELAFFLGLQVEQRKDGTFLSQDKYESTISVIKNLVAHSKTKHIKIRFHFIRDSYEKRLIEMVKIHTDNNVADLLTKAFDVTRFQFLIASIDLVDTAGYHFVLLVQKLILLGSVSVAVHIWIGLTARNFL